MKDLKMISHPARIATCKGFQGTLMVVMPKLRISIDYLLLGSGQGAFQIFALQKWVN